MAEHRNDELTKIAKDVLTVILYGKERLKHPLQKMINGHSREVREKLTEDQLGEIDERFKGLILDWDKRNEVDIELRILAGVFDMLFLINEADAWSMRDETLGMVILDARDRTKALIDQI